MFTKPVIAFGSAAPTQVFFGSERATPQAFSASGRRCRLEPLPQQDWVPNPGLSRHSRCQRPYAENPRVAASPRCDTGPGPTADFPNLGERGAGVGRRTLCGWVTSHPTPELPHAAPASRAGSLPPEQCGGRGADFITADGAVAAPGDPRQRCKPAALAAALVPPRRMRPWKARKRGACSRVCRWAGRAGKFSQAEIRGTTPHPRPRGRWPGAPLPWWRGPRQRWPGPPERWAPPPPQGRRRRWARARPASRSPPPAAPGSAAPWSSRHPWLFCGSPAPRRPVTAPLKS